MDRPFRSLAMCALAAGCARPSPPPVLDASTRVPPVVDAGVATATVVDAGPSFTPPTQIVALGAWVPVRATPRRDGTAVGYLREGAIVAVEAGPVARETCPVLRDHPEGGWYRVTGGGFVCVGGRIAVPWPSRHVSRPTQPRTDAGMPYDYAIVYGRAVLYREPPSDEWQRTYEPWRYPHPDEPDAATAAAESAEQVDDDEHAAHAHAARTEDPPVESPDEPRLRDLRGDRGGPVIRRLLTGMYVALDRIHRVRGERWWRTQSGGFVRTGPLSETHHESTFAGTVLDATTTLPYAFVVGNNAFTYRIGADGRSVSAHHAVPRFTGIALMDSPPITQGTQTYWRTLDGMAVHDRGVRVIHRRPPPAGLATGEHWIDVDLDAQTLVVYAGEQPVFATLVSTGRRSDSNPDRDYETPAGSFRVRSKHITNTMDGDTVADGPYSIEDVPWVQFFHGSYALHGTFWHGNFGYRMSHGCVNLSPSDSRTVFQLTEPSLPAGWHVVFASAERPGTRVELHHGATAVPRVPTR